jgi:glycosyltransferase involved in cell wall biosynthesis
LKEFETYQKIAFVANTSWSIYNFRLGLINHLQNLGFQIVVIAPRDEFSAKLIAIGCDFVPIELESYSINPFHDINIVFQLRSIYQKHRPDIIFHYTIKPNIYGSIAAAWCNIPSIAITTGLGMLSTSSNNKISNEIALSLYRLAGVFTNEMWFLNEPNRQVFIKKNIIRFKKAHLLPSEGVDTEWFKPRRNGEKAPRKHLNFLFAGRLIRDKGIFEFVEAARLVIKKYPQARFQILGFISAKNPSSISEKQLKKWESEKILTYLGETTDVRPYLEDADCILYPSYYGEGISRILLEAGSMAIPIITTDNTGCREVVIPNVSGFLCKPKNVPDLVKNIEQFICLTKEKREKMGKKSREYITSNFDESIIIALYIEAIKQHLPYTEEVYQYSYMHYQDVL